MTEMLFPTIDEADEFGGIDHLVPPGQDPELLHRLLAAFTAELGPKNFIERMWVRDMALQSAMLEYVRRANCAVHQIVSDNLEEGAEVRDEGEGKVDSGLHLRSHQNLGNAFASHLTLFDELLAVERALLCERDRVIRNYDTRTGTLSNYQDMKAMIDELKRERGIG